MNTITLLCKICPNIRTPIISKIFKRTLRFNRDNKEDLNNEPERVVKVAVIGIPNAGKSTLINSLIDRKVCATSSKVHTTRGVARGICTEGNTQIVFLDTPGLVSSKEKKRYQLEESFVNQFKSCLTSADTICVVHDVSNPWTRDKINFKVRKLLEKYSDVPSVLVLNKIDLLKSKRLLLDLTDALTEGKLSDKHFKEPKSEDRFVAKFTSDTEVKNKYKDKENNEKENEKIGWPNFTNVFMVSSIDQTGIDSLKEYLMSISQPSPWIFDPLRHTDLSNQEIICQSVRAKLMDFMSQEIPYRLKVEMEYYDEAENGTITTSVIVTCPNNRIKKLLEGAECGKLKQITANVVKDLRNAFYQPINVVIVATSSEKDN